MGAELLLGLRLQTSPLSIIKLNDINLKEKKVEELRSEAAGKTNLSVDAFDLIYCGCILEDHLTLESCGLKNGSMIHVIQKQESTENTLSTNTSSIPSEEMLISMFKSFVGSPLLELAMRRLVKRPEVIENIISSCQGLRDDAVAVAILQDPDLVSYFTDPETIKKMGKLHPSLLEAAHYIASAVPEEAHNFAATSSSAAGASSSNGNISSENLFGLDNFSEDEEMAGDSSQSSDSATHGNHRSRNNQSSSNPITSAQLFSALSRASRRSGNGTNGASGSSSGSNQINATTNPGGVITYEMFDRAMQQAFASTPTTTSNPTTPISSDSGTPSSASNLQTQISLMHEMGLINDAINIQALQITNGDVQAAIELVLSGFGEN